MRTDGSHVPQQKAFLRLLKGYTPSRSFTESTTHKIYLTFSCLQILRVTCGGRDIARPMTFPQSPPSACSPMAATLPSDAPTLLGPLARLPGSLLSSQHALHAPGSSPDLCRRIYHRGFPLHMVSAGGNDAITAQFRLQFKQCGDFVFGVQVTCPPQPSWQM